MLSARWAAGEVTLLYANALRASVMLGVVALAMVMARRRSAAATSVIGAAGLLSLLALPLLRLVPGGWVASLVPSGFATPFEALGAIQIAAVAGAPATHAPLEALDPAVLGVWAPIARTIIAIWGVGVALMLARFGNAWWAVHSIGRRSVAADSSEWRDTLDEARAALGVRRTVRLLLDTRASSPLTWGTLRPTIVLPAAASAWPAPQRRAIVLHELAHVRARDSMLRAVAHIARTIFWYHPGVWWLARKHAADRERACDDCVLAAGVRPTDYAMWLVALADTSSNRAGAPLAAGIARPPLARRIEALVDRAQDRRPAGRFATATTCVLIAAMVLPIGLARLAPTDAATRSALENERWETRAYGVAVLAARADSASLRALIALMGSDSTTRVRHRAAVAIARLQQGSRLTSVQAQRPPR